VFAVTNLNFGRLQYREVTDDPDARVERLTGLDPDTAYRIYLRAATGVGNGEPIFIDARTEQSGRKSQPTQPSIPQGSVNESVIHVIRYKDDGVKA